MEQLLTHVGMRGITHVNPGVGSMCRSLAAPRHIKVSYSHVCVKTEVNSMLGDLPSGLHHWDCPGLPLQSKLAHVETPKVDTQTKYPESIRS